MRSKRGIFVRGFLVMSTVFMGGCGGLVAGVLPQQNESVHTLVQLKGYDQDQIKGALFEVAEKMGYEHNRPVKEKGDTPEQKNQKKEEIKSRIVEMKKDQEVASEKPAKEGLVQRISFHKSSSVKEGLITGRVDVKRLTFVVHDGSLDATVTDNANMHDPHQDAVDTLKKFVLNLRADLASGS